MHLHLRITDRAQCSHSNIQSKTWVSTLAWENTQGTWSCFRPCTSRSPLLSLDQALHSPAWLGAIWRHWPPFPFKSKSRALREWQGPVVWGGTVLLGLRPSQPWPAQQPQGSCYPLNTKVFHWLCLQCFPFLTAITVPDTGSTYCCSSLLPLVRSSSPEQAHGISSPTASLCVDM